MKIKKNGKVITLTEGDLKRIVLKENISSLKSDIDSLKSNNNTKDCCDLTFKLVEVTDKILTSLVEMEKMMLKK